MTKLILVMTLIVTPLLLTPGALAGEAKFSDMENVQRIPVSLAQRAKRIEALETFYGDVLRVSNIKTSDSNIQNILRSAQIEMNDGQIFYPEEIEYLLKKEIGGMGGINKAPHTPD